MSRATNQTGESMTNPEPASTESEAPKAPPEAAEPDWKDRYIRLAADFDNHRKRTRSERDEVRLRERDSVLRDWLEVADSTERALHALRDEEGPWVDGLKAIQRQMSAVLQRYGVARMDTDEASFDPARHEAIGAVPAPGVANGTILQTERTGYEYVADERVLRPARVVVARQA